MNEKLYNFLTAWKETLLSVLLATVCLSLFFLFPAKGGVQDLTRTFFFLGLIPALYIIFVLKKKLRDFGLAFPTDKANVLWFFAALLVSAGLGYALVNFTPFKDNYAIPEYAIANFGWFVLYELVFVNILIFFFDAFFRGFVLFNFVGKLGFLSVPISAAFFALFLLSAGEFSWEKAPIIILSFTGAALAYKTRSFIHSYLMGLLFIMGLDAYIIYSFKQLF
jgi:hypothetical protein